MHVKQFFCMFYNAVFVYLYLYGLWPEIKSYYYYYLLSIFVVSSFNDLEMKEAHNKKKCHSYNSGGTTFLSCQEHLTGAR